MLLSRADTYNSQVAGAHRCKEQLTCIAFALPRNQSQISLQPIFTRSIFFRQLEYILVFFQTRSHNLKIHYKMAFPTPMPLSDSVIHINDLEEFPALSRGSPSLRRSITESTRWNCLFPSKRPQQTMFPTPPIPPTELSSPLQILNETKTSCAQECLPLAPSSTECIPSSQQAEFPQANPEKDNLLASPTQAECMSIMSVDTAETRGTAADSGTPWDSPIMGTVKESISSVDEDEAIIGSSPLECPNRQDRLLPAFEFQGKRPSTPPNRLISNLISSSDGDDHHNTPSFIQGPIPLKQLIDTDPHRIIHAIKQMMRNIIVLEKMVNCPGHEVEQRQRERMKMLADIERYLEEVETAKLITETGRAEAVSTTERGRMNTKFNPSAVSCPFSSY